MNMPRNMENFKLRKNHVQIGGSGAIRGGGGVVVAGHNHILPKIEDIGY